jgi:hypothetical protein
MKENMSLYKKMVIKKGTIELDSTEIKNRFNGYLIISDKLFKKIHNTAYVIYTKTPKGIVKVVDFLGKTKVALYSIDQPELKPYRDANPVFTQAVRKEQAVLLSEQLRARLGLHVDESMEIYLGEAEEQ